MAGNEIPGFKAWDQAGGEKQEVHLMVNRPGLRMVAKRQYVTSIGYLLRSRPGPSTQSIGSHLLLMTDL